MKKKDEKLEALKKEVIRALVNASENDGEPVQDSEEKKEVILKKQATFIAMRFFREDETYEDQIMNECEAFYAKYGLYPNAIVSNPETFDRWQAVGIQLQVE
ncbi:MAG: hypothetical protein K6A42_10095 [Treponema sp.]|nr:hypothetical protein [Treponema sp.]